MFPTNFKKISCNFVKKNIYLKNLIVKRRKISSRNGNVIIELECCQNTANIRIQGWRPNRSRAKWYKLQNDYIVVTSDVPHITGYIYFVTSGL